jgi:broad-specificity NMP kinase
MIIILAGNIASGKTSVARAIQYHAPKFHLVGIDEYRAEGRSEEQARLMLLQAFGKYDDIIYETTTANKTHDTVMAHLHSSSKYFVRIRLGARMTTCLSRKKDRKEKAYFEWDNLEVDTSMIWIADHLRVFHAEQYYDTENLSPSVIAHSILKAIDIDI